MNGIVVIGEGEKDNAPMLYNGEQVGDGTGPECDVAVDPIDGTTLTAKGMTNAIVGAGGRRRAARCTTRPRSSTWRSWSPAPRPPTSSTSGCPVAENIHQVAKAKGVQPRGRHRRAPRPAAPRGARRGDPGDRRADQVHHRRRRRRRDHGGPPGHRRRPAARHRRHPRGHHRGLRDEVPRRRDPGPALADGRRGAAEGASTPATTSTAVLLPPTTWSPATTASSSPPASPTASCCAACATAPAAPPRTRS